MDVDRDVGSVLDSTWRRGSRVVFQPIYMQGIPSTCRSGARIQYLSSELLLVVGRALDNIGHISKIIRCSVRPLAYIDKEIRINQSLAPLDRLLTSLIRSRRPKHYSFDDLLTRLCPIYRQSLHNKRPDTISEVYPF